MPKLKAKLDLLRSSEGSSTVDLNEVSARHASDHPTPLSSEWCVHVCTCMCIYILCAWVRARTHLCVCMCVHVYDTCACMCVDQLSLSVNKVNPLKNFFVNIYYNYVVCICV